MNKVSTIFLSFFLLFGFTIASSQTILHGTVTEYNSGERVPYASVAIYKDKSLYSGQTTDEDGKYIFEDLSPGVYDVSVSYTGYISETKPSISIIKDATTTIDFRLHEGAHLDEVIVVDHEMPAKKHTAKDSYRPASASSDFAKSMTGTPSRAMSSPESYASYDVASSSVASKSSLPSSGQMTAGEWNDLHNWKDWMALIEEDNYGIMTERFEIYPTERYSVLVLNKDNAVLPNVPVSLLSHDGEELWNAWTDNAGKAELWGNAFNKSESPSKISVDGKIIDDINTIDNGSNTIILDQSCSSPDKVDIVFTVDATSSMADEINYLKAELLDVIDRIEETNSDIDFNIGSVFYRDVNDEYLSKESAITDNHEEVISFVSGQNASGGGDIPEAVEVAIEKTLNLNWRSGALKIAFLILDAPPHEDDVTMTKIRSQIKESASKGIKLIPITASGIGRETEFLMKFMAMMTNGTYVFITDDSGIGDAHLDPVVKDYEVEKLNDCIVRLISDYSKSYSCDAQIDVRSDEEYSIHVFPNPSTQYINVNTSVIPNKIKVLSSNGMVVKTITPSQKETRIELDDLVNGVYTVSIYFEKEIKSKQIILLK